MRHIGTISSIERLRLKPFLIGIYYGKSKPSSPSNYLKKFVEELKEILISGVSIQSGNQIRVGNCSFVVDAPARAFIYGIKYPTGFYSCNKCTVKGESVCTNKELALRTRPKGRVVFLENNCSLRSDASFRSRDDKNHHNYDSILEQIPHLDMVNNCPLDPMHLIYLGVTRLLVDYLLNN